MEKLKIADIFYSIQGEGSYVGVSSIFIRFFGCNLKCDFCDDLLHKDKKSLREYSIDDIFTQIQKYPSSHIIITGGEPSLYDLREFISALQDRDYFVSVESNGYKFKHINNADWITYSPKDWDNINMKYPSEYKFIINKESNIQKILELDIDEPIYIQPQNDMDIINKENLNFCIDLVKQYPYLRLSVQLHKFLGVL
jgi:organic radical activating enzyme